MTEFLLFLSPLFELTKVSWYILVNGGSVLLLTYCLIVTMDRPKRARFYEATRRLTEKELVVAQDKNLRVFAEYKRTRGPSQPPLWAASEALMMATVLEEHLARVRNLPAPRSYRRSRKAQVKRALALAVEPQIPLNIEN